MWPGGLVRVPTWDSGRCQTESKLAEMSETALSLS